MLIRFEQELRNIRDNVANMNVCEKDAAKKLGGRSPNPQKLETHQKLLAQMEES